VYNSAILSTQSSKTGDPLIVPRQYLLDALKARDIDKVVSLLDGDTVWMPPNDTSLYGLEEVKDWWKEYFEYFRITSITEPERELTICGELAIEHTTYMLAINPIKGGTRIRDDGRMLTIWKKQPDGSWKIWRAIWNSTRPVGSGTNRYMSRLLQKRNRSK
jgi:ketosteroid isomerase-like protein